MHIGIAGIGKMGAAIAQRLMEAGHKVSVWNRSADKTKPVVGCGRFGGGDASRTRHQRRSRHHDPHRRRGHRRRL